MSAQQLQQVARRTISRRGRWLSLGLLFIVAALAAQRYTMPQVEVAPAQSVRPAVSAAAQGWPGATLMGSAYSGQTPQALRRPVANEGWPGATLMGSAYDGQTDHATRHAPAASSPGWPGATLMGSAYSGQ
ncbi:MAG: hypothetical protein ACJ8CR_26850 [Roseiflexaceae bacterium]